MSPALLALWLASAGEAVPNSTSTSTAAETPVVDLITIGVGDAMYAVYGHAALRVKTPDGRDMAYNFGGVDMKQPNFWLRLMQGQIDAYLEVTPYSKLLLNYSGEDRSITGRTLELTPEQATTLVEKLDAIAGSDARFYRYHHIFDNCTTRVAHLVDDALGGQFAAQAKDPVEGTHRDWILERIRNKPWVYLAMDLAGNGQGDVPLVAWDLIFIPEAVDSIVDRATVGGRPLVRARYVDYKSLSHETGEEHGWPWLLVYVLLVGPLMLLGAWRPRVAAGLFGAISGLIGLSYAMFWLFSDYDFYHRNWNMLVFPPSHFLLLFASARVSSRYLLGHGVVLALLLVASASGLIVQAIGPMLGVAIPVTAMLLFRSRRA